MSKPEYDALEELLRRSEPRPIPASADIAAAKAAVRKDWQDVAGKRRTQRRIRTVALAATVLAGLFAVFNAVRTPIVEIVQVASIEKQLGDVYVLGEDGTLREIEDVTTIQSGQMLVTASEAAIAIAWGGGGSLRIDANTRIRFVSDVSAFLEDGRVYFDSRPGLAAGTDAGGSPNFLLETDRGTVRHVGTQYMVEADASGLVVSVREGEVEIKAGVYEERVSSGQQATLSGSRRPYVLSIDRFGERWGWISRTTPARDVNGRTLHEFLTWVGRETGLEIRYEDGAEAIAKDEAELVGTVSSAPLDALPVRVATAALEYHIEEGVIYIRE